MIDIKITVKNDHKSLTIDFAERQDLMLSVDSDEVKNMAKQAIEQFGEDADTVIIKCKMEI